MAEEEVEEKKSKGGLIKIILFAVGGIMLVVMGLGVGYFVFGSSQPDPSEEIETIIERKMESQPNCHFHHHRLPMRRKAFRRRQLTRGLSYPHGC